MEKDSLYKLVKSLTPNEKGYFIKYGFKIKENEKQKILIGLLDLLSKADVYEEQKIKESFAKKSRADFRIIKFELFQRLVDSLTEFKKGKSTDSKVFGLLEQSQTLLNKGLYHQSRKLAEKAEKLSNEEDRFDLSIVAISHQKDTFHNNIISPEMLDELNELRKKEESAADKIRNISHYRSLFEQMRLVEFTTSSSDYSKDAQREELKKILSSEYLQNPSKAIAHESKYLYHICYSIYYGTLKDHKNRLANSRALLKLMEGNKNSKVESSSKYRNVINQFLNACLAAKDLTGFDEYLNLLEDGVNSITSPYMKARTFLIIKNQRLNKNFVNGEVEKNKEVIEQFKEELMMHEQMLPPEIFYALYSNILITYFYCGDYRAAIPFINKIINEYNPKINKGVISMAQCMNLIVHFELENYDLLHYLIKTSKAEKDTKYFELMGWLILLVETELNKKDKQKEKQLEKLFDQLKKLMKDESEKELMKDFYLDRWLSKRYKNFAAI
ncbi:MAG: hypothetical protein ACJ76F_05445 [Bacteroidia bacterium]